MVSFKYNVLKLPRVMVKVKSGDWLNINLSPSVQLWVMIVHCAFGTWQRTG